jgi:hypothetical protein
MADTEPNLSDSVATSAAGPKMIRVEGMGQSEEHPLTDQIAAAKFKPLNATQKRVGAGIRFTKATAGGAL